jgi:hypothetical protein
METLPERIILIDVVQTTLKTVTAPISSVTATIPDDVENRRNDRRRKKKKKKKTSSSWVVLRVNDSDSLVISRSFTNRDQFETVEFGNIRDRATMDLPSGETAPWSWRTIREPSHLVFKERKIKLVEQSLQTKLHQILVLVGDELTESFPQLMQASYPVSHHPTKHWA